MNEPIDRDRIDRLEGRVRALEALVNVLLIVSLKRDREGMAEVAVRIQELLDDDTLDSLPESFGQGVRETLRKVVNSLLS